MNKISDIASLEKDFIDNIFNFTSNIRNKWPKIEQVGAGKTVCFLFWGAILLQVRILSNT